MKSNSGFTLIEMVAVIIILAIMAATALPKFASLTGEARYASLNGLVGGLRSAVTLSRAKWLSAQSGNLDTVNFNDTPVSVVAFTTPGSASEYFGVPLGSAGTVIDLAMDSWESYASSADGSGGVNYWPAGVAVSSNCYVNYRSGIVSINPLDGTSVSQACS